GVGGGEACAGYFPVGRARLHRARCRGTAISRRPGASHLQFIAFRRCARAGCRKEEAPMNRRDVLWSGAAAAVLLGGTDLLRRLAWPQTAFADTETFEIERSEAEWRKLLTPEQYHVLR